jgi:hypothetical protein
MLFAKRPTFFSNVLKSIRAKRSHKISVVMTKKPAHSPEVVVRTQGVNLKLEADDIKPLAHALLQVISTLDALS